MGSSERRRARNAIAQACLAGTAVLLLFACSPGPRDSEWLLESARVALEQGTPGSSESMVAACEAAWPSLKQIGSQHAESPEGPEAFRLASACLKIVYNFRRYTAPDSPFVTDEPDFMLEWLVHFFGEEFPQQQVDQLLVGMPYVMFLELQQQGRPELTRWEMYAKRENGRTEYVTARPADVGSS